MDADALLATARPSADRLVAAARAAGLDAPVPSCPEWDVAGLVAHTGTIMRWITSTVRTGERGDYRAAAQAPEGEALLPWLTDAVDALVAALQEAGRERPTWTFAARFPQTSGFWWRRAPHELAVHAVDAQLAAGEAPTLDAELASDGIDELLTALLPARLDLGRAQLAGMGTLHVHCTDVDGEWLVTPVESGVDVLRAHAKGDAALRGPAADLLLRLQGRGDGGEVMGDPGVLERLRSGFTF